MAMQIRSIIEVAGKPKEHVEETIKKHLEEINKKFEVTREELNDCVETEDKIYTQFAELELNFKSLDEITVYCFNYMPATLEILGPAKITFNDSNLSTFLSDMMARLHDLDIVAKSMHNQLKSTKINMNHLLMNYIKTLISQKALSKTDLEKLTGVQDLSKFLEHMVNKKDLVKEGDMYAKPN